MPLSLPRIRHCVQTFDFKTLFIQELGWDRHSGSLDIPVDGRTFTLQAIAEKRGLQVFECAARDEASFPDYALRRKIDRQAAKSAHEHIIIYTDAGQTRQIWQWVKRELGRPLTCREHTFQKGQTGDALVQKLQRLAVDISEEENITLTGVLDRVRHGLDLDRITKRFYERFQKEHTSFLKFIKGLTGQADREWYASLMLNRLMFIYFIQKKGFLDGDLDYLRNRLMRTQERKGKDKFLTFYRYFLRRLFHEGLGQPQRTAELEELLGQIPFVNGGLFDVHDLERDNPDIQIPDEAFVRLFDFFDAYQWHLDERPLRADNEINPDVLGYIFEKYINQKQMGAYYTKEDITGYIARNTIVPFLFDAAEKKCSIAFRPDGAVWRLLKDNPDRYIYASVQKGVDLPLPAHIEGGIEEISRRDGWNRPAAPEFALPTETWREHVARRQRCIELRTKLANGEIHDINDLITYNLDISQFAEDVIENCEGPELLRAFYHAIENVSVLDPTCGSGAFLFAALNILEPLYEACLERMQAFLDELERSGGKHHPEKFGDFRKILQEVDRHANRRYFVLKSIIINNLYGVDIMEEAVEICKLRLFLKLVAQVEKVKQLEPLPDIDFNIRPGNTLVGFATIEDVKKTLQAKLGFEHETREVDRINEDAEVVDRCFQKFREMQTEYGMDAAQFAVAKVDLRTRLDTLRKGLDAYLAGEYAIGSGDNREFHKWQRSHQPFHWFAEYYHIMNAGGFDVVIGNPPWAEYSRVKNDYTVRGYETESCGNLHGICTERGLKIRSNLGVMSFIVQLPLVSSSRMVTVRNVLRKSSSSLLVIPFDDRPGKLFDGLEHCRSVIWVSIGNRRKAGHAGHLFSSRYQRWPTQMRAHLFELIEYVPAGGDLIYPNQFPKYPTKLAAEVFEKVKSGGSRSVAYRLVNNATEYFIFYQEATQYWVKAAIGLPYYAKDGRVAGPAHGRHLHCQDSKTAGALFAVINSNLFYSYFVTYSDCFHLSDILVRGFPVPPEFDDETELANLGGDLMSSLESGAERQTIKTGDGHEITYDEYYGWKAKSVIDRIDHLLAKQYGFTGEELDFIINYDIKYRMGQDAGGDDDE